jgi:hypothetical protein
MLEGVNLTKTYCKHVCKCHNVPSVHNNMRFKKLKLLKFYKKRLTSIAFNKLRFFSNFKQDWILCVSCS